MSSYLAHGPKIYPKAHENPRGVRLHKASTQQEVQAEVRKPTRHIMRRNNPKIHIIGDPADYVQTGLSLRTQGHIALISKMEPKHIDDAMQDDNWVKVMQEEVDQFQKNNV